MGTRSLRTTESGACIFLYWQVRTLNQVGRLFDDEQLWFIVVLELLAGQLGQAIIDDTVKICRSMLYLVASDFKLHWVFARADHLLVRYFILPFRHALFS